MKAMPRSTGAFAWCRRATTASSLALARCRGGLEHPGAALNDGPLFRVPIVASAGHPLSATALGGAGGPCLIDAATHLMRQSALIFQEKFDLGVEEKLRLRAQNAYAVAQCRKA